MASSSIGIDPPRPIYKESDINKLFEEVKHIAIASDYNFDNYMITIGDNEPASYTQIMNHILNTIKSATEDKTKNEDIPLQQRVAQLNNYIGETFTQENIQDWNASKNFTTLTILNHFIRNVYAFLLLFINQYLRSNILIKQKYDTPHTPNLPPDHNLRNYYDTAKNILKNIKPEDNLQGFTKRFVENMVAEEEGQKKEKDDKAKKINERNFAERMNSEYMAHVNHKRLKGLYQVLTPLTTSFNDSNGDKVTKAFYIQNFGGGGDCLFLTLLAILKVYRPAQLVKILNEYQNSHTNIFTLPYTDNVIDIQYEAWILRHVIVDYILNNLQTYVYPEVERNQRRGLTASTRVDMYGGTYENRLTLPPPTKVGDLAPNGGASPDKSIFLFLNGVVTTNDGTITNIDKSKKYDIEMKLWDTYGTEVELAAATQLFNINIIDINTDGVEERFLFRLDDGFDAYIFHQGHSHYMNIWPNDSGKNDVILAVDFPLVGHAIHPEIRESSSIMAVPPPQPPLSGFSRTTAASSPPSASSTLPGGVVQVFGGYGKWDDADTSQANIIFAPIRSVIDDLIQQGYEHIGLTYAANQNQTIEIFNKYGFNKRDTALPSNFGNQKFDNNNTPSWWPSGGGQAYVLQYMKQILNDPKYQKHFRIIPFSTMEYSRASGGTPPNNTKNGDTDDCIRFAELFLQQDKSIILGWSGLDNYLYRKLVVEMIENVKKITDDKITKYFSIGGDMCRKGVNTPQNSGIDLMIKYAKWAIERWNNESQQLIDNIQNATIIDEYIKYATNALENATKNNTQSSINYWTDALSRANSKKIKIDRINTSPPSPPAPPSASSSSPPAPPPSSPSASPPSASSSTATAVAAPPYLTLTNMIAGIDTSIDNFVEQLSQRNPLKEISVNETGGKSSGTSAAASATTFTRVDGDFPKNTVPLYEQMVYHRAGSMNMEPLSIFIPTGYKINFQEINEYFREMARRNDPETQELMNLVFNPYGNTPSAMFYKHTLPGKPATGAGARPVMFGGAYPSTTTLTSKGVFNLDPKTEAFIQFKIDKWHRSYIDWCFYRNATRFFVEKRELPKDELVTLKMEFDEVFDAAPDGEGLMKMVKVIEEDYTKIKDHYSENVNENPKISTNSNDFKSFIYLFDILYAEIQKYKTDPLDYITERKKYFPSYSFDANSLSFMVQVFDKFRSIFIQLKLLDESAHDVKHFIETVPYLSQLETLQSITDEFMRLKQSIEMNPALKSANEIFEKYMLTSNGFIDINRQMKHIPSYNLIQYVFQTICYNNEPLATPPPPPSGPDGLFEDYVAKLYPTAPSMATPSIPSIPSIPSEPKDIFDKPIDDDFISKLYELSNSHSNPNNAEITELRKTIDKHNSLIVMLNMRKSANSQSDIVFKGKSKAKPSRSGKRQKNDEEDEEYDEAAAAGENQDKQNLTKKIKQLNEILFAYDESTDKDSYTNNDSLDDKIKQVETKIKLLKGKYFVSSLLFYNYHFVTDPASASSASSEVTIAAANFFQKFYTESKLGTPELDAFPQKNAVHFSFGIDLIFWLMFRISKYYFASFHANFIENMREQIGPQNVVLRSLRENVQYKESKLNHVCELAANLLGISVVRIIPDRSSYLIKTDGEVFKGFVRVGAATAAAAANEPSYSDKWKENIQTGIYSGKVKYVTNEMAKGLNKALGLIDPAKTTNPQQQTKDENHMKMKIVLVELLQHNTIQVVHMLFAKPRDIWYSPDMRTGSLTSASKWAIFRLEKPEIVTKSAFKSLKEKWDEEFTLTTAVAGAVAGAGTATGVRRLDDILNKTSQLSSDNFKIKIIKDESFKNNTLSVGEKGLCVFLVETQPSPQMLAPGKDSANEPRFQNQVFSIGDIIPTINDDHAVGAKLMQKLKDIIRPDAQKCSNVRGLINEQASELSSITKDLFKSAGVDFSIKFAGLKNKMAAAAANNAMQLLVVVTTQPYNIQTSPPQPNIDEAYKIASAYKGEPDFDAIIGYCLYLNGARAKTPADADKQQEGLKLIFSSYDKNSKYSGYILGLILMNADDADVKDMAIITSILNKLSQADNARIQNGGGGGRVRRINQVGGGAAQLQIVLGLFKRASANLPLAKVELVKMFMRKQISADDAVFIEGAEKMIKSVADEEGYAQAEFMLAEILNPDEALKYYERAAAQGHKGASYKLAKIYLERTDKSESDRDKAHTLLTIAAKPDAGIVKYDYTEEIRQEALTEKKKIEDEIENEEVRTVAEAAAIDFLETKGDAAQEGVRYSVGAPQAVVYKDNDIDDSDSDSVVDVDAGAGAGAGAGGDVVHVVDVDVDVGGLNLPDLPHKLTTSTITAAAAAAVATAVATAAAPQPPQPPPPKAVATEAGLSRSIGIRNYGQSSPLPSITVAMTAAATAATAAAAATAVAPQPPPSSPRLSFRPAVAVGQHRSALTLPPLHPSHNVTALLATIKLRRISVVNSVNAIFSKLNIGTKLVVDPDTVPTIQNGAILIKQFIMDDINLTEQLNIIERAITARVQGFKSQLDAPLIRKFLSKYAEYSGIVELKTFPDYANVMRRYDEVIKDLRSSYSNVDGRFEMTIRLLDYPTISLLVKSIQQHTVGEMDGPIHKFVLRFVDIDKHIGLINAEIERYPEFERSIQDTTAALLACVRKLNEETLTKIEKKITGLTDTYKPIIYSLARLEQNLLLQEGAVIEA